MFTADWSPQHGDAFWLPRLLANLSSVVRLDACLIPCSGFALMRSTSWLLQHRASAHHLETHTAARHLPDVLQLPPARLGCLRQTRVALGGSSCSPPSACVTMRRSLTTRNSMVGRTTIEQTEELPWLLVSLCTWSHAPIPSTWRSVLRRLQHATCGRRNLSPPALTMRAEKANTRPQKLCDGLLCHCSRDES